MRRSIILAVALAAACVTSTAGLGSPRQGTDARSARRSERTFPEGFVPAVASRKQPARYFVVMRSPSLLARRAARGTRRGATPSLAAVKASQDDALAATRDLGGRVVFRYGRLVNAYSAQLSPEAAAALAKRSDVARVEPVNVLVRSNSTSVPFIGSRKVWRRYGVRGQGMKVAVIDTGIDYTHKDFGGSGKVSDYNGNDPDRIERSTFPTKKVIDGYDFVGGDYSVLDNDPTNDLPNPDPDPLDTDGHGTHTAGTCCGQGVKGKVGKGVAPKAKILSYKVWDVGDSTADVLVAAYERAVDPNEDGKLKDAVDVVSFSGGVDYGTAGSLESIAAQAVVDAGVVFVAAAGNAGNQAALASPYVVGAPAVAPGVIAVAASVDRFLAQVVTVDAPSGVELPDGGVAVHQSWSPGDSLSGPVMDARAVVAPGAADGSPSAADAQLCGPAGGNVFHGDIALVYKGSTGAGDCTGSEKAYRAQQAGASGVILWSGFSGAPFDLAPGDFSDQVNVPVFMVDGLDGEALGAADSPAAPAAYDGGGLEVTIASKKKSIPGYANRMTDFSSEGPARVSSALKPDITAPGAGITSAGVGTGTGGLTLDGTSMAAPHVSGAAALLRQLHPRWDPARIKAALMNQALPKMYDVNGGTPVSATVMGAGRIRVARSAAAVSLAYPASLSFGLEHAEDEVLLADKSFTVRNFDKHKHHYSVTWNENYTDYPPGIVDILLSKNGQTFDPVQGFDLRPHKAKKVTVRVRLRPQVISEPEQEFGWYFFHPNVDGAILIRQTHKGKDKLRVPWHVAPVATSDMSISDGPITLTGSQPSQLDIDEAPAAGRGGADIYQLGVVDDFGGGEEDITHIGARSFAGPSLGDDPVGSPGGPDEFAGIPWVDFLTADNAPDEPLEFVVRTSELHNTTATNEVDVLIDAGNDGKFADEDLQADFLAVEQSGVTCLLDLSVASPFDACTEVYFQDYSSFNSNLVGVVIDAGALGLKDKETEVGYGVVVCTDAFSGDAPTPICDSAGDLDPATQRYPASIDVTSPDPVVDPLTCDGFWDGPACSQGIQVSSDSTGGIPSLLAVFPNNAPADNFAVVPVEK